MGNYRTDLTALQVIVGDESHVYNYEAGGMSVLGGVAFNVIPTLQNGELPLDILKSAIRRDLVFRAMNLVSGHRAAPSSLAAASRSTCHHGAWL